MSNDLEKFKAKLLDLIVTVVRSEDQMLNSEDRQKLIRRHIRLEREIIKMYKDKGMGY